MVSKAKYSAFQYKAGNSFLHKTPSWIKILIIPLLNILFFILPPPFAISLIVFQTILAFSLHFTIREQLADLRAVIYYAILLLFVKIVTFSFSYIFGDATLPITKDVILTFLKGEKHTLFMLLKLFCVMQSASLVFKTSTSLEIREGVGKIEYAITKKNVVTDGIFLFISFIPSVSKIWKQSTRAWYARGGKHNVKMYLVLLPVLFSVGMKEAYNKARAVSIRKMD